MNHASEIFETNYNNYCRQIAGVNFSLIKNTLGIEGDEDRLVIPFLNRDYRISKNGITDASGDRPDYITCVILAKYVLLCPDHIHQNAEWVSFKDFRKTSHFTNLNFFRSDVEQAIVKGFSGRIDSSIPIRKRIGAAWIIPWQMRMICRYSSMRFPAFRC